MDDARTTTTTFSWRGSEWKDPDWNLQTMMAHIDVFLLPSSSGLYCGFLATNGLHGVKLPCTFPQIHLDSAELVDSMFVCLKHRRTSLDLGCTTIDPSKFLTTSYETKGETVHREFLSAKGNIEESGRYTVVQVFHHQKLELENIGPVTICFAFHILTQFSGENFVVQTNTSREARYAAVDGYHLVRVPVLFMADEMCLGLMRHFQERKSFGQNSFCGLEGFSMLGISLVEEADSNEEDRSIIPKDLTQNESGLALPMMEAEHKLDLHHSGKDGPCLFVQNGDCEKMPAASSMEPSTQDMDSTLRGTRPWEELDALLDWSCSLLESENTVCSDLVPDDTQCSEMLSPNNEIALIEEAFDKLLSPHITQAQTEELLNIACTLLDGEDITLDSSVIAPTETDIHLQCDLPSQTDSPVHDLRPELLSDCDVSEDGTNHHVLTDIESLLEDMAWCC